VPVTELRAAIIIGSGQRVVRDAAPPRRGPARHGHAAVGRHPCQPIAIRDVLRLLCEVLDEPETAGKVLEVGGPDVLTYREMMQTFAEVAGLRRRVIVPVPVLTPRLSSLWVGLVTPLPTGLARPLVGSLVNEVVVTDPRRTPAHAGAAAVPRGAPARAAAHPGPGGRDHLGECRSRAFR
jgi:uncharacterized protein YbjT (DUF2867 family)